MIFKNHIKIDALDKIYNLLDDIDLAIEFFNKDKINSGGSLKFIIPTVEGYKIINIEDKTFIKDAMEKTNFFIKLNQESITQ